jgi:acyl-CoA thioester hydrolase
MADLSLFRFSTPITVRFSDLDALRHVNNVTVFTYLEVARVDYAAEVLGWDGDLQKLSVIIARAECSYEQPIYLGDDVRVYLRTARIGTKSFTYNYAVTTERGGDPPVVAAVASTVQVAYDYTHGETIPVPAAWRERIAAYEPALT